MMWSRGHCGAELLTVSDWICSTLTLFKNVATSRVLYQLCLYPLGSVLMWHDCVRESAVFARPRERRKFG